MNTLTKFSIVMTILTIIAIWISIVFYTYIPIVFWMAGTGITLLNLFCLLTFNQDVFKTFDGTIVISSIIGHIIGMLLLIGLPLLGLLYLGSQINYYYECKNSYE